MPTFSEISVIIGTGEDAREIGQIRTFEPRFGFMPNAAVSRIIEAIVRARLDPPEVLDVASPPFGSGKTERP